jgi:sarcosine/dimethylglycine N-methyltransferase
MTEATYSEVVQAARDYYNSEDADNFYFHIWGGEDIHVGLYQTDDEEIAVASRRTVKSLADRLVDLSKESRVLDIGAGYGGAARYLALNKGCHVTALNLSEAENRRNRQLSKAAGVSHLVDVVDGSFEVIPAPDESFDVVWSQDAILHSGHRDDVVREVARVLKPGGRFIFTDIMQAENADPETLKPVLERIHLDSLGSLSFYRQSGERHSLQFKEFEDFTPQLVRHYTRVAEELTRQRPALKEKVSEAYIERMLKGLLAWQNAGKAGQLVWGIQQFQKAG